MERTACVLNIWRKSSLCNDQRREYKHNTYKNFRFFFDKSRVELLEVCVCVWYTFSPSLSSCVSISRVIISLLWRSCVSCTLQTSRSETVYAKAFYDETASTHQLHRIALSEPKFYVHFFVVIIITRVHTRPRRKIPSSSSTLLLTIIAMTS